MLWVGRDLKYHLVATPLPWAGTRSTRHGFSKPHPAWAYSFLLTVSMRPVEKVGKIRIALSFGAKIYLLPSSFFALIVFLSLSPLHFGSPFMFTGWDI